MKQITNKLSTPIRTILARKRFLCERWRDLHNHRGRRHDACRVGWFKVSLGQGGQLTRMPSFDVVSEIEVQEVRNAVDQAARELGTRFDFRGVDAGFDFEGEEILVWAEEEFQVHQLTDVLKEKLAKRKVDVGALDAQALEASGKQKRVKFRLRQGIDRDVSRHITKLVKDSRFKVQAQVQGDKVRVTGKKRDDLQTVMGSLRDADIDIPLQFNNFRD